MLRASIIPFFSIYLSSNPDSSREANSSLSYQEIPVTASETKISSSYLEIPDTSWKADSTSSCQDNVNYLVESESSLPSSKKPTIVPYPQRGESTPWNTISLR